MTQQPGWIPPDQPSPGLRNIGLWGAPTSGKTTFLSALKSAVEISAFDLRVYGTNEASSTFLSENTLMLDEQEFPRATDSVQQLAWILSWTGQPQVYNGRHADGSATHSPAGGAQLTITMRDAPGRVYGAKSPYSAPDNRVRSVSFTDAPPAVSRSGQSPPAAVTPDAEVIDHLAGCYGMILLVDPMEERETGTAYRYFQATVDKVAQRRLKELGQGRRLPHYVAVCMTKFDHPTVFGYAQRGGFRVFDESPQRFPRIPNDQAERFLVSFCRESAASRIDRFCGAVQRYFYQDRVRFFVTSSIGFYVDPVSRVFSEDDYQNMVRQPNDTYRIRGEVNPINVLEPLLWLGGWTEVGGP